MYEIRQSPEFVDWIDSLDMATANRIVMVLLRMSAGNWGDYKPLPGAFGVFERRLMGRGPGIRLYFCRQGNNVIMLLTGGDKSSQQRRDVARAQRLRERYL